MYNIPEKILACSVRIANYNRTVGSGFLYTDNNVIYLVTAKHVLLDAHGDLLAEHITIHATKTNADSKNPSSLQIELSHGQCQIQTHAEKDICVIKIMLQQNQRVEKPFTIEAISQAYVNYSASDLFTGDFQFVGDDNLGAFDTVKVSNDAFILGFPHSLRKHDERNVEMHSPLLRKGIVSGKNVGERIIVLDCEVNYGNSGGPAFQAFSLPNGSIQINIIGIVSTFIPYSEEYTNTRNSSLKHEYIQNSGYSTVVPIDFLYQILRNDSESEKI